MRAVRSISYMVYSLNCIISDMKYFIIVFTVSIFGYAAAFHSLSEVYETPLVNSSIEAIQYSYLMATNVFDTTGYDGFTWTIFLLGNILNVIILLNLLIAIISNSF